jgi:hypothetical protein
MNNATRRYGRFALQLDDPESLRAYLETPRRPIFDLLIDGELVTDDGVAHGNGCACCETAAVR